MSESVAPPKAGGETGDCRHLADLAVARAQKWVRESEKYPEDRAAKLLSQVLEDQTGLDFTVAFVDGVIRPEDIKVAAEELNRLASSSIGFLPWYLRLPFKIGGAMAPLLPNLVIPITRSVFAKLVEMCIRDSKRTIATPPSGLLSLSRRPPPKKNNICATEVIRPPMAEATEEVKISRL